MFPEYEKELHPELARGAPFVDERYPALSDDD